MILLMINIIRRRWIWVKNRTQDQRVAIVKKLMNVAVKELEAAQVEPVEKVNSLVVERAKRNKSF